MLFGQNPGDQNPRRIRKTDRMIERALDFKDIKFLVKIKDNHKIGKMHHSVVGYEKKVKYPI